VSLTTVVFLLVAHVNVPPDVNAEASPLAEANVALVGVHFESVTLPEMLPLTLAHTGPCAPPMVTDFVVGTVSVAVVTVVLAVPVAVGFLTSLSTTESTSPAFDVLPKFHMHCTVVPVTELQSLLNPSAVVASVTVPPSKELKVVPVGSFTVSEAPG
jgi:hypothetical protein